MLTFIYKLADGLSLAASRLADIAVAVLVCAMVYEVFARYVLHAPTEWAFDIAYMSNGAIFLLGVAWVLRQGAHIRIDIVRNRLPKRLVRTAEAIVYLGVLLPFFGLLGWLAANRAFHAWQTNEVEMVSPWAPLMWPFYLIIAVGLVIMSLQLLACGLRIAFDHDEQSEQGTGEHA